MWIHVPSTCSLSVPDTEDSSWGSDSRARLLEQSATLRSKPTLAKSWLRACKNKPWMQRLFGRILRPLTAANGVASWISYLGGTLASHFQLPASSSVLRTLDTCGRTSLESFERSSRPASSSRTSRTIYEWDSLRSDQSFDQWVIELRQGCSARKKLVLLTRENASSSTADDRLWSTASARDWKGSPRELTRTDRGGLSRLDQLDRQAEYFTRGEWPPK